jgi:hypothetical protein
MEEPSLEMKYSSIIEYINLGDNPTDIANFMQLTSFQTQVSDLFEEFLMAQETHSNYKKTSEAQIGSIKSELEVLK